MTSEVTARFNSQPGYAADWHVHDTAMLLAPARGVFQIADESGDGRITNVPPGAFYWIDAHHGHCSRAGVVEQMHWVCYLPAELLRGAVGGRRSGISALSRAAEHLLALQALLAEDRSVAAGAGAEKSVSELIWRECAACIDARDGPVRTARQVLLAERVNAELRARLHEHPGLDMIARLCGVSRRHLTRLYRMQTGQSVHARLNALRMQHAAALLATSDLTVMQVAAKVGFENPSHFARAFRHWHGVAPRAFRARAHY